MRPEVPHDGVRGPGRGLFSDKEWESIRHAINVSPREFEILKFVFDDRRESAIAESLGMSPHTVHTHMERLYRRLGVTGRCSAILHVFAVFRALSRGPDAPVPP